uniref:Putative DNA binding, helix-turn-helix domain containing protein n=1 Tax=viral metagenome TaxID=1070528 RepID=A0A6M3K759_9ZZZZ
MDYYSEEAKEDARKLACDDWCVAELMRRTGVSQSTLRAWREKYPGWPEKWGVKGRRNQSASQKKSTGRSEYTKEERGRYTEEAIELKKGGLAYSAIVEALGVSICRQTLAVWCRKAGYRERENSDCNRCDRRKGCEESLRARGPCLCEKEIEVGSSEEDGESDEEEEMWAWEAERQWVEEWV